MSDGDEYERSALSRVVDVVLGPVHAATSKPAQRAYLGTVLFAATSLILLCISSIAYTLFYYSYLPQIGTERTVHLQFGHEYPHGIVQLSSSLASLQPYDISVQLHLPRSPINLAAGNFMIDMNLVSPTARLSQLEQAMDKQLTPLNFGSAVIARSRRPAILTYASPIVDTAYKLSSLPWYIMRWKRESEVLEVSMFEGIVFSKGWKNIPDMIQVIVETDPNMQFYEVSVKIVARFRGIRYMLYNHRIISFIFFTTTFFLVSLISALAIYILIGLRQTTLTPAYSPIKPDPEDPTHSETDIFNPLSTSDLSDTARTFPTLGRQPPLHYRGGLEQERREENARIKREDDAEYERVFGIQPTAIEADDEDEAESPEDVGTFRDSGIGTGMDDRGGGGVQRRRKGGTGGKAM